MVNLLDEKTVSISGVSLSVIIGRQSLLDNVSLNVKEGEILSIIGPNGAGKSTLVATLAGDMTPSNGTISYDNRDLTELSIQDRAMIRSVMAQSQPVAFDFSVQDIIKMGWVRGSDIESTSRYATALACIVEDCSIAHLLHRKFNTLSGGEHRRVHFARALVQLWRPETCSSRGYLLLDEPVANLDLAHEIRLLKQVRSLADQGVGVLLVLHDLNIAAKFSDKIAILQAGRLACIGSPGDVLTAERLTRIFQIPISVDTHSLSISYY